MITFKPCIYVKYHVNRAPILVQFIEGEHRCSWSKVLNKECPFGPGNEKHGQFYKNGYQRICFVPKMFSSTQRLIVKCGEENVAQI